MSVAANLRFPSLVHKCGPAVPASSSVRVWRMPPRRAVHMGSFTLPLSADGDRCQVNARRAGLPPPPKPEQGEPWALFLDVDGTLLDFVDDPAAVRVSP